MAKTFDELKALAESVYDRARDMDRDHAVILILEAIAAVYSEGQVETLNEVEKRFAARQ